jgi:hypothetical protein
MDDKFTLIIIFVICLILIIVISGLMTQAVTVLNSAPGDDVNGQSAYTSAVTYISIGWTVVVVIIVLIVLFVIAGGKIEKSSIGKYVKPIFIIFIIVALIIQAELGIAVWQSSSLSSLTLDSTTQTSVILSFIIPLGVIILLLVWQVIEMSTKAKRNAVRALAEYQRDVAIDRPLAKRVVERKKLVSVTNERKRQDVAEVEAAREVLHQDKLTHLKELENEVRTHGPHYNDALAELIQYFKDKTVSKVNSAPIPAGYDAQGPYYKV